MSLNLTPGKLAGLKAVSDRRGVIAAVAMDQRGLLKNMLAREMGIADPPAEMMTEFKQIVARTVTKEASAILLDLEYGLEAAKHINGKGLLLAYEHAGYSPDKPERLPSLSEGWSALRLKEAGASAIKILVYYTPFEKDWVNDRKKAWVERIGAECKSVDIPYRVPGLRRARRRDGQHRVCAAQAGGSAEVDGGVYERALWR
jgi:tagatose 1,6-diphosphate aldolase